MYEVVPVVGLVFNCVGLIGSRLYAPGYFYPTVKFALWVSVMCIVWVVFPNIPGWKKGFAICLKRITEK